MKAWRLSNSRLAARAKKAVSTEEQEHLKSRMITKQQVKHQFLKIDKIPSPLLMALLNRVQ